MFDLEEELPLFNSPFQNSYEEDSLKLFDSQRDYVNHQNYLYNYPPSTQDIFIQSPQEELNDEIESKKFEIEREIIHDEKNINYENINQMYEKEYIFDVLEADEKENVKLSKEKVVGVRTNQEKTNYTSKENAQKKPVLAPFVTKIPLKRIDYLKKSYKTHFNSFLTEYGNLNIENSDLPAKFKKKKLSVPNSKSFTENTKGEDNYNFLEFSIKKVYCYYKSENCKISRQLKNKKLIEDIMRYIDGVKNPEKFSNLINHFNMSLEEGYRLFEESKYFKKFCNDSKVISLDKEFIAQKGFSLRTKKGFIRLISMYKPKK